MPEKMPHAQPPVYGEQPAPGQQPEKLKAVIVKNEGALETRARDIAEAAMSRNKSELKGVGGIAKKIWVHNLFQPFYRQKEVAKAKQTLLENKNLYAGERDPARQEEHKAAMGAIVTRFASEYDDETILHQGVDGKPGEWRNVLGYETDASTGERRKRTDTEQEKTVKGAINELILSYARGEINKEAFEEEKIRIFGVATGEGKNAVGVAMEYADNLLEIAEQVKTKALHEEGLEDLDLDLNVVIGKAKAGVRTEAQFDTVDRVVEKLQKTKVGRLVNETTLTSVVAAVYSLGSIFSQRLIRSRAAAIATFGGTAVVGAGLAAAREGHRLEEERRQHARERAEGRNFDSPDKERRREMEKFRYETKSANDLAVNVEELLYEGKGTERRLKENLSPNEITKAIAELADIEARIKLSDTKSIDLIGFSDVRKVEEERTALDILRAQAKVDLRNVIQKTGYRGPSASNRNLPGYNFDKNLKELTGITADSFQGEMGERDKLFKSMKHREMGKKALVALGTGLVIGAGMQEIGAAFNPNMEGLIGHSTNPDAHQTALHGLIEYLKGNGAPDSQHHLSAMVGEGTGKNVPVDQYIKEHEGEFHRIIRKLWYENDTPKPVFDKNELRLDLALDKHTGNYDFSTARMAADGSYETVNGIKLSAEAHALAVAGKLKMLFSLSRGTQHQVIEVPIGSDFKAHIDPNSEIGKLLFSTVNGKPVCAAKFAEVAEMMGNKNGVDQVRLLATAVGKGIDSIHEEAVRFAPVDLPPIVPLFGRTPLERENEKLKTIPPSYYSLYGANSPEAIQREFKQKNIDLDPYTVTGGRKPEFRDKNGKVVERQVDRERERIEKYMKSFSPEYKKELEDFNRAFPSMDEKCRLVVTIPARLEGKNITTLLDQYVDQKDAKGKRVDPELYEINIIENKKNSEAWDDTSEKIKAWKVLHPEIRVNVMKISFDDKKARVGLARKYVADLSLLRSAERKKQDGTLYIESEDADIVSMDKRTVGKLIKDFDKSPHLDVLRGIQDRQPEILKNNDFLFFGRRLRDIMEAFLSDPKYRPENNTSADFIWNRIVSGGWNTAFTAEAYAQVGGYDPSLITGEDMDIGQKISILRGRQESDRFIPNTRTVQMSGLRASSSPRRFINALVQQKGVYEDFENQDLKKFSLPELMGKIKGFSIATPEQIERYENEINGEISFLRSMWDRKDELVMPVMDRTLFYMGLKKSKDYDWRPNGEIELKPVGMQTIIDNFKTYKKEKRWELGYRRQNYNKIPGATGPEKAGVPFILTRDMKQQLADLGWKKKDRDKLTPERAQEIIAKGEHPVG